MFPPEVIKEKATAISTRTDYNSIYCIFVEYNIANIKVAIQVVHLALIPDHWFLNL